jgi:hypothetical protein
MLTGLIVHDDLQGPANQLGFAIRWRRRRDTREPLITRTVGAWRDLCAAKRRPADLPGSGTLALKLRNAASAATVVDPPSARSEASTDLGVLAGAQRSEHLRPQLDTTHWGQQTRRIR